MSAGEVFRKIHQSDAVLSAVGWLNVLAILVMVTIIPWDSREVMGINPWFKPMKFAASIAIFVWTVAWYLRHLPLAGWPRRLIRWGIGGAMMVEILCIALQAARGTTSHYNVSTPFDAVVFNAMSIGILVNTLLMTMLLFLYLWHQVEVAPGYRMGLRLGLILFVIGSLQGMLMIMNTAHTVGAEDGGAGLPFLNWSTGAGDLRVAHMVGLHALQVMPLIGFAISRCCRSMTGTRQAVLVVLGGLVYTAVFAFVFQQAAGGEPLLRL